MIPVNDDDGFRHEDEMCAASTASKTELSHLRKDLDATKATLAQQKMSSNSLNSQVGFVRQMSVFAVSILNILFHIFGGTVVRAL